MRRLHLVTTAAAVAMLTGSAGAACAQDSTRAVAGGGIQVAGWQGKIDAREAERGSTINDTKLVKEGDALHATTGPATSYWNPENEATGDYTVRATFREPSYMALNDHPHPFGLFIGGSDMEGDQPKYLYCMAYGNGNFIVRGFGPEPFQLNGRRGESHDAVNKGESGQPVTQEIALSVKGDRVECAINGTTVGSYPKSEVVQAGRLSSTDGVYGIRLGHNTEAVVTGLTIEKP